MYEPVRKEKRKRDKEPSRSFRSELAAWGPCSPATIYWPYVNTDGWSNPVLQSGSNPSHALPPVTMLSAPISRYLGLQLSERGCFVGQRRKSDHATSSPLYDCLVFWSYPQVRKGSNIVTSRTVEKSIKTRMRGCFNLTDVQKRS